MQSEEVSKFCNYPISIHKDAVSSIRDTVDEAMDYSIYTMSLKLAGDTEIDKLQASASFLNITINDLPGALRKGKLSYNKHYNETVMVSISKDILFDFYKSSKTEFEVMCFCAYAATRSILGKKPYMKITNDFFIARMFGFGSIRDMPAQFKNRSIYKEYTKRYTLDKIKKELTDSWGLKLYGRYTRGFYISYTMGYETLVLYAEKNRKVYKNKVIKAEKEAVLLRVLAKLELENTSTA